MLMAVRCCFVNPAALHYRWGEARGRPRRVWRARPEARNPKSPRRARRRRIPTNHKSEYMVFFVVHLKFHVYVKKRQVFVVA